MRLSEEQRAFAEENHNLIYWYMNLKSLDKDEWYGLLAIELCKAVTKYDPNRGQFSTYYKMRCDSLVSKERKKQQRKRSLEKKYLIENENTYVSDIDVDDELLAMEMLESEYGNVIKLKAEGYTQSEIGEMLGVNQCTVSRILTKVKELYDD